MLTLLCFSTAMPPAMLLQVGCAKRHTVVLTSDGEPLTWGHRIVTPRRVQVRSAHMPVQLCMVFLSCCNGRVAWDATALSTR